jgi:copper chaperone CopZ/cytochrome c biogenesis protein CcdA
MARKTFSVESIHCGGCEANIRGTLNNIDGIGEVEPDRRSNSVTVDFDDSLDEAVVVDALASAGFPVTAVADAPAGEGSAPEQGRGGGRFLLLAVAVVLIAVAGYIGYVLYPRFDLPAVQGAGLLGLAAAAGLASFFSPCSFPLLVGLLSRQAVAQGRSGRKARPVVFGGALAAGAATFMLLAGLIIAAGGEALFAGVTFTSTAGVTIRAVVGAALVLLGLMQTGIVPLSLQRVSSLGAGISRRQARLRRQHPVAGFGLFGFGYVLAGFG